MSKLQLFQFRRLLHNTSRALNAVAASQGAAEPNSSQKVASSSTIRPPVPKEIINERFIRTISPTLGRDRIRPAAFDRTRVVPELMTYYGGNPLHDATIDRLNGLVRKYIALPTTQLSPEELGDIKFVTFEEYKNDYIKSDKVKLAHHKEVLALLTRLRSIDGQLMPVEVIDTLNEFVSKSSHKSASSKVVKTLDANGVVKAKGGKKTSRSIVRIVGGEGLIMVNGVNYNQIFTREDDRNKITYPLLVTQQIGKVNVFATVHSGGISSQADAVRLGIIKALGQLNPIWKSRLNSAKLRPTDLRIVERKKPGKLKARKSPTWVKR